MAQISIILPDASVSKVAAALVEAGVVPPAFPDPSTGIIPSRTSRQVISASFAAFVRNHYSQIEENKKVNVAATSARESVQTTILNDLAGLGQP